MPEYVTRDSVLAILRNRYADATDWEHRILERLANDVRDLPAVELPEPRVVCNQYGDNPTHIENVGNLTMNW